MRSPQRAPSPSARGNGSASQEVLITTSRMPWAASFSRCQAISGLPPTGSSGFGVVSVSGRMRSPRPAAKIRAFMVRASRGKHGKQGAFAFLRTYAAGDTG